MRKYAIVLCLLGSMGAWSQKAFQGKAVYQSKTTFDMNAFGNDMSEERKKRIKERMKNFLEKTYTLHFTTKQSVYKEEAKLQAPGSRGSRFGGFSGGETTFKDVQEPKVLAAVEFFGKKFLIEEPKEKLAWEMTGETKQIGKYTCFKATLLKKNTAFDWRSMRRKPRGKKKEKQPEKKRPKEILVTAWYTPQIPVSSGPGSYWGLPGLILEINEGRTTLLCSEIVLNPQEKIALKEPTKGEKVTREEYNKIIKKKMEEMREMFQRRRGGGNGRGRGRF
ncbi:Ribonuclease Z [Tenacibaculum litopenaei]|uniref:GLPGLI family protein n=1 Tax=Tenacibaculum litopenaei TaxID=396016 RepID=UPI0038963FB9